MLKIIGSSVALFLLTAGALPAQQLGLTEGTRVRIHTAGAAVPVMGTVAYRASDGVAVLRAPGDTAYVPLGAITRVDVSAGRHSNAGRGARVGALIGVGLGALLGMAAMVEDDGYFDYGAEAIPAGMLGGGLLGVTAGVIIGAVSSREQWTPGLEAIAVSPAAEGIAVSARLSF